MSLENLIQKGKNLLVSSLFLGFGLGFYENARAEEELYTVRRGDSLYKISSSECGKPNLYKKIAKENNIKNPAYIKPGQKIKLPESCFNNNINNNNNYNFINNNIDFKQINKEEKVEKKTKKEKIIINNNLSNYSLNIVNNIEINSNLSNSTNINKYFKFKNNVYKIKKRDTLTKIAKKECGNYNLYEKIAKENNIKNSAEIRIGQKINLPEECNKNSKKGIEKILKMSARELSRLKPEVLANKLGVRVGEYHSGQNAIENIKNLSPIIKKIANKYDVPFLDIATIIYQESGGNILAISHTGCLGLGGVSDYMSKHASNEIKDFNQFNPEHNIEFIGMHFSDLLNKYKNEKFALTAYNVGETRLNNAILIAKANGINNFDDIINIKTKRVKKNLHELEKEFNESKKNNNKYAQKLALENLKRGIRNFKKTGKDEIYIQEFSKNGHYYLSKEGRIYEKSASIKKRIMKKNNIS